MKETITVFDANAREPVAPALRIHHSVVSNCEASFAMELVRSGMLAARSVPSYAVGDNVDNRMELLPVEDVVQRACAIKPGTSTTDDRR